MPLKLDDFELIQDAYKYGFDAVVRSLLPDSTYFILKGCVKTIVGSTIHLTEGYIFVTDEIYYIPAAEFTEDSLKVLYVAPDFSTTENRIFHDTNTHDVWDIRVYKYVYSTGEPAGGIIFASLFTLLSLLQDTIGTTLLGSADLTGFYNLSYEAGFSAATSYTKLRYEGNSFNGYMILGAFNAAYTYGLLTRLPIGMRPTGDLVGFFYNGSVAPGVLRIKKNGEIWINGARTNGPNYITFQFYMRFEDPVLYNLPGGGGGVIPDGDIAYDLPTTEVLYPTKYIFSISEDTLKEELIGMGYKIKTLNLRNLTGNSMTLKVGTTAGGADLYEDEIPASSVRTMDLNMIFSPDSAQDIYFSSENWNDVTIDVVVVVEKIY